MSVFKRVIAASTVGAGTLMGAALLSPSPQGVEAVKQHEALRQAVYLDAVGVPTICYGSTGRSVYMGMPYASVEECNLRLQADLDVASKGVQRVTKHGLTQGQFDALVSFAFNVGTSAYAKSTMLRKINAGDCHGAAAEFDRWVFADGKRLRGLVKRRAAERLEFEKGCTLW